MKYSAGAYRNYADAAARARQMNNAYSRRRYFVKKFRGDSYPYHVVGVDR